jgi:hypothetical protein
MHNVAAELADRQYGMVAMWQLMELGYSRQMVSRRLGWKEFVRVHAGVFFVGHGPITFTANTTLERTYLDYAEQATPRQLAAALEAGRRRDTELQKRGWRALRITYRRLHNDPAGVIADVRYMLNQ